MATALAAEQNRKDRATWRDIALLFVAALLVRGSVAFVRFDSLADDPDGYRAIAANLVERGVYARNPDAGETDGKLRPTAYRPPLYVLLLAAISPAGPAPPSAVGVLHVALGAVSAALIYVLARRWELGWASWLAAAMLICDPLLLAQSTEVMTETLAVLLVIVVLLAATSYRRDPTVGVSLVYGAVLALAVLCRPTFLPWLALLIGWEFWLLVRRRAAALRTVCLVASVALVLAPWVLRTWLVIGEPIIGTTHGGYTLWLGNSPEFYEHLSKTGGSPVYDAESVNRRWPVGGDDELNENRRRYDAAIDAIQSQPKTFAWASALRIAWLWTPLPHQVKPQEPRLERIVRYGTGAWFIALYLLAATGAIRLGRRLFREPWVWAVLLCLVVTALHTVYWTNMRMCAPLEPILCLLAAEGLRLTRSHRRRPVDG